MVQTRAETRRGAPPPPTIQPFSEGIENSIVNRPLRKDRIRVYVTRPKARFEEPSDEDELLKSGKPPHEDRQSKQARAAPETNELSFSKAAHKQKHSNASDNRPASGGYTVLPAPNIIGVCWAFQHALRGIVRNLTNLEFHNLLIAIPPLQLLFEAPDPPRTLAWLD